jgi:hypothetical protein
MGGNPIHDHADPALMQVVDKITKIIRRTVASRGREVVADLIAPRWPIWMFLEGQKLNVCKAGFLDVVRKRFSHFAISKGTIAFFNAASPRSKMHFVD